MPKIGVVKVRVGGKEREYPVFVKNGNVWMRVQENVLVPVNEELINQLRDMLEKAKTVKEEPREQIDVRGILMNITERLSDIERRLSDLDSRITEVEKNLSGIRRG